MTVEGNKRVLQSYGVIDRKIKSLLEQKMELIESICSVRAVGYDDMPKGHHQTDLSDCMVKLERLTKDIDDRRMELLATKIKIERAIMDMPDGKESDVLRQRYIALKSWDSIATSMSYEVRQVHRIHGRALQHINLKMS